MTIEKNTAGCVVIRQGKTDYFTCWAHKQLRERCPYTERVVFCNHPERDSFLMYVNDNPVMKAQL